MSRHPYTYADDFIRILAGHGKHGAKLSRSDALQVRQGIAQALGMDNHELACKLCTYFQANEDELEAKSLQQFAITAGIPIS